MLTKLVWGLGLSATLRTVWGYISLSQYSWYQGIPICCIVCFILHGLHIKPDIFLQTNLLISVNIHRALGVNSQQICTPYRRLLIREPLSEFSWNFILGRFVKICWTIPIFVENGTVNEAWHEHLLTSLSTCVAKFLIFIAPKKMFGKQSVEIDGAHFSVIASFRTLHGFRAT